MMGIVIRFSVMVSFLQNCVPFQLDNFSSPLALVL